MNKETGLELDRGPPHMGFLNQPISRPRLGAFYFKLYTMHFAEEIMSDEFTKYHVIDAPFGMALHKFTGPDKGLPHDHPWGFTSFVVKGGYVERVYKKNGHIWTIMDVYRAPGESFYLPAEHIHQIVKLPHGECWTVVLAEPWKRNWNFWDFSNPGEPLKFPFNERPVSTF